MAKRAKTVGNTYKCGCGCGESFKKEWPRQIYTKACAKRRKKERDRAKKTEKTKKAVKVRCALAGCDEQLKVGRFCSRSHLSKAGRATRARKEASKSKPAATKTPTPEVQVITKVDAEAAVMQMNMEKRQRFADFVIAKYKERLAIDASIQAEALRLRIEESMHAKGWDPIHVLELLRVHHLPNEIDTTSNVLGVLPSPAEVPANGSAN